MNGRISVSPPLPIGVYARRPLRELPFPLEGAACALFPKGRQALWHAARGLGPRPGDEVLMPAYNCGSEVEALDRAGFACRFYAGRADLQPDERELDGLLGPRVRALYVIHYLGFPQDMPRWRRWCDERGLMLIEDAAQGWLSFLDGQPLGSFGDLAIISLYKSFALPDGAALVAKPPEPATGDHADIGLRLLARRHAAWLYATSPQLARLGSCLLPEQPFLPAESYQAFLRAAASDAFALGAPGMTASVLTRRLLRRLVRPEAAARRRENYRALLEELGDRVSAPFADLPERASPFAFPVETHDKATLLDRLARHGVRALDLWPVPHPLVPVGRFTRADSLRARVIALPVHQELGPGDVDRIVRATRDRRPLRSTLILEPVETLAALDGLRDEWTELAERSANVFATWEWNSTWWRHFGGDRSLVAATCRSRGGRLVAILPLYRWSTRPLRILRFLGHGVGDQLGPICDPADRAAVAGSLSRYLDGNAGRWDVLLAEHLPRSHDWSGLLGGTVIRRHASLVLPLEGWSWDGFLASRSANFRQQVRRRERKLAEAHELRYRLTDPDRLQRDLESLFELHRAQWRETSSAFTPERRRFHHDFATRALERGWLQLRFLELDGRTVAGWYGLRFAAIESYYQAGRDPVWSSGSVGFVLLAHSIRQAFAEGLREYRFLRGDEEYKYRFTADDSGLETFALSSGSAGAAAVMAAASTRHLRRIPSALRDPLGL